MGSALNPVTIARIAAGVQKRFGESDPWKLAKAMHIMVSKEPMGLYDGCCKGFFIIHHRIRHITINSDLPEAFQRIVLAHELGHAVLHAKAASGAAFHEMTLFDDTALQEYEANVFASELLLPDEEVLQVLNEDSFFFRAAGELYVPAEMLDFKFRIMKRKGYQFNSPITPDSTFMKHLEKGLKPADDAGI